MKRILILVLITCMMCSLVACKSTTTKEWKPITDEEAKQQLQSMTDAVEEYLCNPTEENKTNVGNWLVYRGHHAEGNLSNKYCHMTYTLWQNVYYPTAEVDIVSLIAEANELLK